MIPSCITLRSELNEAEQANIIKAREWAFGRKRNRSTRARAREAHSYRRRLAIKSDSAALTCWSFSGSGTGSFTYDLPVCGSVSIENAALSR